MVPLLSLRAALLVLLAGAIPLAGTVKAATLDNAADAGSYQSMSLAPEAVDALRRKVLIQCGLESTNVSNLLPWYFHFEYGRALLDAGDAQRAVVQLNQSISLRPEPRARKRTYGMWFLDYLPYFQLAEAHAMLANWPCAEHAMQLSESTGEIELGRIEPQRIHDLRQRIETHLDNVGSCNMRDYQNPLRGDGLVGS